MNAKKIKSLYPKAHLQKKTGDKDRYFHYFDGYEYLLIPYESLSDNEQWFLTQLSVKKVPKSPWYAFLMGKEACPKKEPLLYQCFHFETKNLEYPDEWLMNLQAFFTGIEDAFFITENRGVIISHDIITNKKQIEAGLALLDDDFSSKTKAFLGIPSQTQRMPEVFREEQSILNDLEKGQGVQTVSQIYLQRYFVPQIQKNILFQELSHLLQHEEDAVEIIQTLWKNQGNISASSKDLHMHRNTLLYRLNKIEEQAGLNLRDLHQLFLAYLLTF